MRLLIDVGANLEAHDCHFGTPLHVACAREHLDCVKVLLNAGAFCSYLLCPAQVRSVYTPFAHGRCVGFSSSILGQLRKKPKRFRKRKKMNSLQVTAF